MTTELSIIQSNLQAKVSEKIKVAFMDLIPPEAFDAMVSEAMDEFINGSKKKRTQGEGTHYDSRVGRNVTIPYNPVNDPDTLPGMIMKAVQAKGQSVLNDIMAGPEFSSMWDNGQHKASKTVQEMIGKNSEVFVTALFSGIISSCMRNVSNELRNSAHNLTF